MLVTDASRGSAIAVIRSLGRAGYRVIAVDPDPRSLGFRSRYTHKSQVVPPAKESPQDFVDALHRIVLDENVDLVICLDAPGEVVFRRKGEFSPEFLETRRHQYREFEHLVDHFELVDANRDLDLVVQDVTQAILRFENGRHNGQH